MSNVPDPLLQGCPQGAIQFKYAQYVERWEQLTQVGTGPMRYKQPTSTLKFGPYLCLFIPYLFILIVLPTRGIRFSDKSR